MYACSEALARLKRIQQKIKSNLKKPRFLRFFYASCYRIVKVNFLNTDKTKTIRF